MDPDDNTSLRVASFACYLDTAKDNMVHRSVVSSSQPDPNSPAKQPPFSIKFSKPRDSTSSLRVESFSYLHTAAATDNNFVFEVPGPIQDPTSAFTFSNQDLPKDSEISIFGADKYFNMKLDNNNNKSDSNRQADDQLVVIERRHRPAAPGPPPAKPGSPSLKSEASSWNSQSALISNPHTKGPQIKQKRAFGRKIFTGFGCKGPCFSKKSIHVTDSAANDSAKPARVGSDRMSLPIPNLVDKVQILDESRYSIEVFGSGKTASKVSNNIVANMERKLSMLTWDAIPKGGGQNVPTSTSATACDDMASEASSDLFEIENISGSIFPLLTSEPPDGVPSSCMMSPTSQYAPSEASIQWSVVTASAADYSTVLSEYNDEMSVSIAAADPVGQRNNGVTVSNTNCRNIGGGKEAPKSRAGGLLGCKSQKSVNVAENACLKSQERSKNQGLELSVPFGKSQYKGRGKIDHIDTLHLPVTKSYNNSHPSLVSNACED